MHNRHFIVSVSDATSFRPALTAATEVLDWNNEFLAVTRQTAGNLLAGPPEVSREMAIVGNAMSDAIDADTGSAILSYACSGGTIANALPDVAAAADAGLP
jgi:hypothetical protein